MSILANNRVVPFFYVSLLCCFVLYSHVPLFFSSVVLSADTLFNRRRRTVTRLVKIGLGVQRKCNNPGAGLAVQRIGSELQQHLVLINSCICLQPVFLRAGRGIVGKKCH